MELAVSKASPLGQYLAQLDGEETVEVPKPEAKRRRRRKRQQKQQWQLRDELLQRVTGRLSAVRPSLREELQVEGLVLADSRSVTLLTMRSGVVVAAIAAVAVTWLERALWGGVVVAGLVTMEMGVQLVVKWHEWSAARVADAEKAFEGALASYNDAFEASLSVVKRAELASRGYRIGVGVLPPVGRLETPGNGDIDARLRCFPLRRKLRALNDRLQAHATALLKGSDVRQAADLSEEEEDAVGDSHVPSLLLTALTKQHARSALLAENAVHAALVQNLTRVCSSPQGRCSIGSIHSVLQSHRDAVMHLVCSLRSWSTELEAWNTMRDPVALLSVDVGSTKDHNGACPQQTPSESDPRLKGIAAQLQELRSTSETLSALVTAAQFELAAPEMAPGAIAGDREAIGTLVRQLQEAWQDYEAVLDSVTPNGANDSESTCSEADGDQDLQPTNPTTAPHTPAPEELDCTVVFTGTSTGDEGFDLQALLKQQETGDTATASRPLFVRELRDVLAYRQARTQPGKTKQVDHDPPAVSPVEPTNLPPPPPADAMFALPRAPPRGRPRRVSSVLLLNPVRPAVRAFSSELHELLQKSQALQRSGDMLECCGDSNDDDD